MGTPIAIYDDAPKGPAILSLNGRAKGSSRKSQQLDVHVTVQLDQVEGVRKTLASYRW
jgi:hypothetical protein